MNTSGRRSFLKTCGMLGSALVLDGCAPGSLRRGRATKPNFVFILADDLGWMDLGCQGNQYYETPNIDKLAQEGLRFNDAYAAAPVCVPTRASILTGKSPARLHITAVFDRDFGKRKLLPPDWTNCLPHDITTLPEHLKEQGYKTACIGKWHLGPPEEFWPEHHGFDVNKAGYAAGDVKRFFSPYNNPRLPDGPQGEYLTDRLTAEAKTFIETNKSEPFFLYMSHYAPHTPIQAPEKEIAYFKSKPGWHGHSNPAYAAMIKKLDDSVGKIVETIDKNGLSDNTVIIFTSDNGGVENHFKDGQITSNSPLRDAKGTLYEGGLRVPLIIRWPGVTTPQSESNVPVTTDDWVPTLTSLAGARAQDVDGTDLSSLLQKNRMPDREFLCWHYPHYYNKTTPCGAIRSGDWKLIEFFEDMRVELYNLKNDIEEKNNVAKNFTGIVNRLRLQLHIWREENGAQMPVLNEKYKDAE